MPYLIVLPVVGFAWSPGIKAYQRTAGYLDFVVWVLVFKNFV